MRKLQTPVVTGFARLSVTEAVGKNQKVVQRIKRLTGAEHCAGKATGQESLAILTCSMQQQYRVGNANFTKWNDARIRCAKPQFSGYPEFCIR